MQRRALVVSATVLLALAATACGSSDSAGSTGSTVTVEATSFATLPTTPVTVAPTSTTGLVAGEQQYTILSGDYPLGVAQKFGVPLQALDAANAATPGYAQFYVGTQITIPAGGTPQAATTTVAGQTAAPQTSTGETTTTLAGGQPNCGVGSYTLVDGDYPALVAQKFGTTVGELQTINADTPGYSAFYVGLTIKIPAKTAC